MHRNGARSDVIESTGSHASHHIAIPQNLTQETAHLVPNPASLDMSNSTHEGSQLCSVPRTQLANKYQLASTSSATAHPAATSFSRHPSENPIDDTIENSWGPEERQVSQKSVHVAINAADAMGTSSVCDEDSPENSAQYYGGSSGIAFMRAIGKVLAYSVEEEEIRVKGSSPVDVMDPVGGKQSGRPELLSLLPTFEDTKLRLDCFALPSRSISDYLLDNYWTRAYPLYPFLHRPTFEAAYAMLWNPSARNDHLAQESDAGLGNGVNAGPSTQSFYCALNMMLALGSQFADISVSQRNELTTMFEKRSKNLLIIDMMDRGNLAVVQTLLLTGQYLQSTFNPQRCWNCIGVACRIAQALGLHVEEFPQKKGMLGLEMRRRVWYSCVLLDM
jgi:hypothetical protein